MVLHGLTALCDSLSYIVSVLYMNHKEIYLSWLLHRCLELLHSEESLYSQLVFQPCKELSDEMCMTGLKPSFD